MTEEIAGIGVLNSNPGGGGQRRPPSPPHFFTDQLTLSQLEGGADYAPHITTSPSIFSDLPPSPKPPLPANRALRLAKNASMHAEQQSFSSKVLA